MTQRDGSVVESRRKGFAEKGKRRCGEPERRCHGGWGRWGDGTKGGLNQGCWGGGDESYVDSGEGRDQMGEGTKGFAGCPVSLQSLLMAPEAPEMAPHGVSRTDNCRQ
jgi:hypothetical protein